MAQQNIAQPRRGWQATQPVEVPGLKLGAGGGVCRSDASGREVEREAVVVAAERNHAGPRQQPLGRLGGGERPAEAVTRVQDRPDSPPVDIGQRRRLHLCISADVGNDGDMRTRRGVHPQSSRSGGCAPSSS